MDIAEAVKGFVRFPSVSTDASFAEGMKGARDYAARLLKDAGLEVEVFETPRHPILLGQRKGPPDWPHILLYGHYDVQPADPYDKWISPPFDPEIRDGRLYGRGAADNKGPMMIHIAAITRLLRDKPDIPLRITFLMEGEEEIGSPSFAGFLQKHAERLQGDLVMLSDTGALSPNRIIITTGLRGIVCLDVVLHGPSQDVHSGLHGGAIPNPIRGLAELCAGLHDADGRVNVPGFYDHVIEYEEWERESIRQVGIDEATYIESMGVKALRPETGVSFLEAIRIRPTLEFNGIGGGFQGAGSKTIIPAEAMAKISCRLVANQDPNDIYAKLVQTLQDRTPPGLKLEIIPEHHALPYRVTPPGKGLEERLSPPARAAFGTAEEAITEVFGHPPVYLPEGGSVPIIGEIKNILGMDSLLFGIATPRDNLHGPNESVDLQMLERGAECSRRILEGFCSH